MNAADEGERVCVSGRGERMSGLTTGLVGGLPVRCAEREGVGRCRKEGRGAPGEWCAPYRFSA